MTARTFTFETTFTPIPPDADKITRESQLPFKGWFTDNAEHALENKMPHIFVPKAYWVQERQSDPDKTNHGQQRSKLRTQFRDWQASLPEDSPQRKLNILLVNRSPTDATYKEEGVSLWLVIQK